ncbi:uncharacterized protein LOC124321266 [Daphnia pulicaria]|uniref:uncharacterized protein LOC124321266 n=1 Tax=Daphnia pulicaria TaxID=35523 RepID=UPI001EEB4FD3|nr:uncharacterized protein LOC124321266 [Daphnia pulicaria]
MTGTGTQTCSTSPVASPRPHRRHHHHHHHHNHHNHQCGSTSGSINKHGHCQHPQSDEDVDEAHLEPLAQLSAQQQQQQRKVRRGTSHGGWYNRHGKSQDSGRSSDSSTLSLSKRSDKLGSSAGSGPLGGSSLTSPLRGTPSSGRRPTLDPPPLEFGIGSTASTPLSSRKKGSGGSSGGGGVGGGGSGSGGGGMELSRQRSLDSETSPVSGLMGSAGLLMGSSSTSTTPTPVRSHKPNDLFYRDGSLSRSLSFMQQRRPQTARGQGPLFDLWSPQREHQLLSGANSESAPGVDSLCTPMINRKQRSFESGGSGGSTGKPARVYHHSQLDSPKLQHLSSSSSQQQQQQQPRQQRPLGSSASFRTSSSTGSGGRDHPRQYGGPGGSFGSDSSPSPKRESKEQRDSLGRVLRSTDSSPHSAGDSGLATTGSRASQDSRTKTSAGTKSSPSSSSPSAQLGASAMGNLSSSSQPSSASAMAADANGSAVEASGGPVYDPVPLYSNIDYNYYLDSKAQAHLLPLQQYILEQAKLSGYRFGDSSPIAEDGGGGVGGGGGGRTGADHFRSDDEEENDSLRHRLRVPTHLHPPEHDDSDDFADDEGMSNVEDSSSLEYLDESQYLEEDDHYTQFLLPPAPPHRQQSKTLLHHFGPGSGPNPSGYTVSADVIVEPEYTEADPGISGGTYRSLPDGPMASGSVVSPNSSALMHSGSTSSLRPRPKESMMIHPSSSLYSPVMDRAGPFAMEGFRQSVDSAIPAPSSKTSPLQRSSSTLGPNGKGPTTPTEGDIEKYAQSHLNIHKKGLFRKNLSIRDMLSWSKDPIRKPMLPLEDKTLKKEACDLFKLVQIYMGDRKCKPGMMCNSVALELCNHAWNKPALRDELYLHVCRQTTENPRKESLRRGWELMAVCLYFFPPSPKLEPYLDGYINRHRDPGLNFTEVAKWPIHVQVSHYATISCRRLMRIGAAGRRHERKPTLEEIEQARLQIFRPSMFGNTLEEIMMVQRDGFPHRKLPWIQTTLSEEILRLQGAQTEGIFRVPADVDEVNSLKNRMDQWELCPVSDAHVPASLLKLWYRELYESLIPDELYQDCVQYCADPERAVAIVHRLPEFHRLVLSYLIRFLQIFSQTEVSSVTKMDASNLAMVMAPNCLRCNASDPKVIFDNARKEMAFIRTLIQHLDTSFMEGVV